MPFRQLEAVVVELLAVGSYEVSALDSSAELSPDVRVYHPVHAEAGLRLRHERTCDAHLRDRNTGFMEYVIELVVVPLESSRYRPDVLCPPVIDRITVIDEVGILLSPHLTFQDLLVLVHDSTEAVKALGSADTYEAGTLLALGIPVTKLVPKFIIDHVL